MIKYNMSQNIKLSDVTPPLEEQKCSLSGKFENGSCYSLYNLVKMAEAYNEEFPNNKIELDKTKETVNPQYYKIYLLSQFKSKLKKCGDSQKCWLEQSFMSRLDNASREELENNTFRPKGPGGQFTWLDTFNIQDVMTQREKQYPDFIFLGAVPIDFDKLPSLGIHDLDFSKLEADKKTKIGIIFNTDVHTGRGEHWIALYADLVKGQCYFFDSYGTKPAPEITDFMGRICEYISSKGIKPISDHGKTQHQKEGSECGVYSIAFISRMLKDGSFEKIEATRVSDKEINLCRGVYFGNSKINKTNKNVEGGKKKSKKRSKKVSKKKSKRRRN